MNIFNVDVEKAELREYLDAVKASIKNNWLRMLRRENPTKEEIIYLHEYNELLFEAKSIQYQIQLVSSRKQGERAVERINKLQSSHCSLMFSHASYYKVNYED